jgi:AbiJ-like protein
MRFSERLGLTPVRTVLQIDDMDAPLRNSLWNMIRVFYWNDVPYEQTQRDLLYRLWLLFFKWPTDTIPRITQRGLEELREWFFAAEWFEVYDLVEQLPLLAPDYFKSGDSFRHLVNLTLEREVSGFRFVGEQLVRITSEAEITSIEEGLASGPENSPYVQHLRAALSKLGDRENPDYRNSIKESISAVEAVCKEVAGSSDGTLGSVLQRMTNLHPALAKAFGALYGWTSDEGGIRHALTEGERVPDFAEAKFMLVVCSAFVSFVMHKRG